MDEYTEERAGHSLSLAVDVMMLEDRLSKETKKARPDSEKIADLQERIKKGEAVIQRDLLARELYPQVRENWPNIRSRVEFLWKETKLGSATLIMKAVAQYGEYPMDSMDIFRKCLSKSGVKKLSAAIQEKNVGAVAQFLFELNNEAIIELTKIAIPHPPNSYTLKLRHAKKEVS